MADSAKPNQKCVQGFYKVWESYAIGADPNDMDDSLKITPFNMKDDGTPDLDGIEISSAQSKWNVQGATLRKLGKATLDGAGKWQPMTDRNKAGMGFFKVEGELPSAATNDITVYPPRFLF